MMNGKAKEDIVNIRWRIAGTERSSYISVLSTQSSVLSPYIFSTEDSIITTNVWLG